MARQRKSSAAPAARPDPDHNSALDEVATNLGRLIGHAEAQWQAWHGQRDAIVQAVTDVRDRASHLLERMGSAVAQAPLPRLGRRRPGEAAIEKAVKAVKAGRSGSRRQRGRSFTPEQKQEASERMKKYWAARRRAAKKAS